MKFLDIQGSVGYKTRESCALRGAHFEHRSNGFCCAEKDSFLFAVVRRVYHRDFISAEDSEREGNFLGAVEFVVFRVVGITNAVREFTQERRLPCRGNSDGRFWN